MHGSRFSVIFWLPTRSAGIFEHRPARYACHPCASHRSGCAEPLKYCFAALISLRSHQPVQRVAGAGPSGKTRSPAGNGRAALPGLLSPHHFVSLLLALGPHAPVLSGVKRGETSNRDMRLRLHIASRQGGDRSGPPVRLSPTNAMTCCRRRSCRSKKLPPSP